MSERHIRRWRAEVELENGNMHTLVIRRSRQVQSTNTATDKAMNLYPDWLRIDVRPIT